METRYLPGDIKGMQLSLAARQHGSYHKICMHFCFPPLIPSLCNCLSIERPPEAEI